MDLKHHPDFEVSEGMLDAIRTSPVRREVEHCGIRMTVSPFDFYADCKQCGARVKVRAVSAGGEVEDIFDAVFEWMNQPDAPEEARRRRMMLKDDGQAEPADRSS